MKVSQHTETSHELQMRRMVGAQEWQTWHRPIAGMFSEACRLAAVGKISDALLAAEDAHIENYGDMQDVEFRCVTKQAIVTSMGPTTDGWNKVN